MAASSSTLTAPLLAGPEDDVTFGSGPEALPSKHRHFFATAGTQGKHLVKMAFPIIYMNFIQYARYTLTLAFLGRATEGALDVGAAALAQSCSNVTGLSLVIGLCSAQNTIASQAYGAKEYKTVGVVSQRALLLSSIPCAISSVMWWEGGRILKLLHQDPELSHKAGIYMKYLIPSLWFNLFQVITRRFLTAQKASAGFIITSSIYLVFHVLGLYILVTKLDLGLKGAALANSFSAMVNASMTFVYALIHLRMTKSKCWGGLSWKGATAQWFPYLKLALPGCLMLWQEWWCFEIATILSGLLPNPETTVAIFTISMTADTLLFNFCMGLGVSACALVGGLLGEGKVFEAKVMAFMAHVVNLVVWIILAGILLAPPIRQRFAESMIGIGSEGDDKAEVAREVNKTLLLVVLVQLFDGVKEMSGEVLNASGRQVVGAICAFVAYYAVATPIEVVLAFGYGQKWATGQRGLWYGLLSGSIMVSLLNTIAITIQNWEEISVKARANSIEEAKKSGVWEGTTLEQDDGDNNE